MHHASIRTADIHGAIAFYQQLDFEIETRFTAGITLACWLLGPLGRIELIQIPDPRPAADAFGDEQYTGYYHLSFDLTADLASSDQTLPHWLQTLQDRFHQADLPPAKVLLPPQQQQIGETVYEVTFIADRDGLPLEFLRRLGP